MPNGERFSKQINSPEGRQVGQLLCVLCYHNGNFGFIAGNHANREAEGFAMEGLRLAETGRRQSLLLI